MAEQNLTAKRSERIRVVFNDLRASNLHILDGFYHPNVSFRDPLHQLSGLTAVKDYYASLYKNVQDITFKFSDEVIQGDTHAAVWTMTLMAPGLNGGKPFDLDGNSVIKFDPATDKVIYHRDYFDMGEFIYERIPVLSSVVRFVKGKLGTKK